MKTSPWLLLLPASLLEAVYVAILFLSNLKERVEAFVPVILAAGVLYLIAVWQVAGKGRDRSEDDTDGGFSLAARTLPQAVAPAAGSRSRKSLLIIFAAGLLFRATLFPLFPSLSDDLFRYRWDGKISAAGVNPYLTTPEAPELRRFRDSTWQGVNGKWHTAVYGPVTELLFRLWYPVSMLGGNEARSVLLMKLPLLAFDLGCALLLLRLLMLLRLPPERVLVYWWAPVSVVEFAASAHNDSLGVFFLLLALVGVVAGERAWSLAALAMATLSKLFAAFVWPVVLPPWLARRRWLPIAGAAVVGAMVYWPFRQSLLHPVPGITQYSGNWRNNDSLFGVLFALTGSPLAASAMAGAVVAAVAGFLAGRGVTPMRGAFLTLGALLMCSPQVFPWYFAWLLPLLAIYPNAAWLMLSVLVFLSYNVLIGYRTLGTWHDVPLFQWLEYAPFYALLVGGWIAAQVSTERRRGAPSASSASLR